MDSVDIVISAVVIAGPESRRVVKVDLDRDSCIHYAENYETHAPSTHRAIVCSQPISLAILIPSDKSLSA